MLYQQITDDLKTAMKAGDKVRVETIRFALAGLNAAQKEKQMKEPAAMLTDEETIMVLQKDVKRRRDSIELFKQGGRTDLVEKEEGDLAIISAYLPKELSREEIEKIVDGVVAGGGAGGAGAPGAKDFGAVMREVSQQTKGRADGKLVSEIVKAKLG